MKINKRKIIIICISAALIIVFVIVFSYFYSIAFGVFKGPTDIEFSKEEWDENPYNRGGMVDDLLEKYDFLSMTKDEVIELLGEERLQMSNDTLRYETSGGWAGDEILQFRFDENGKIIRVGIAN